MVERRTDDKERREEERENGGPCWPERLKTGMLAEAALIFRQIFVRFSFVQVVRRAVHSPVEGDRYQRRRYTADA